MVVVVVVLLLSDVWDDATEQNRRSRGRVSACRCLRGTCGCSSESVAQEGGKAA